MILPPFDLGGVSLALLGIQVNRVTIAHYSIVLMGITLLDIKSIKRSFNQATKRYDKAAVLQREVADRLLDCLDLMLIEPQCILDCGARTGYMTQALQARYPEASLFSLDLAEILLEKNKSALKICSAYEVLPIKKNSVDMIISNLNLHWSNDLAACLREFQRILKPEGLLLFTLLGRDTLCELRESFGEAGAVHVHSFLDMHDVGDQLLQSGLQEPVMNMETIHLHYQSLSALFRDLKATGTHNANYDRLRGLMGKHRWQKMLSNYKNFCHDNVYPASFEIIYGHAWQATQPTISYQNELGETLISVDAIQRQGVSNE